MWRLSCWTKHVKYHIYVFATEFHFRNILKSKGKLPLLLVEGALAMLTDGSAYKNMSSLYISIVFTMSKSLFIKWFVSFVADWLYRSRRNKSISSERGKTSYIFLHIAIKMKVKRTEWRPLSERRLTGTSSASTSCPACLLRRMSFALATIPWCHPSIVSS